MKYLSPLTWFLLITFSGFSAQSTVTNEPLKEWTFLVFVNGDNDLDEYGWGDLAEAKKSGSTDQVNLVFQYDRSLGRPCRRFYVEKNHAEVVENMGEVDMGDYQVLIDFFQWGMTNYPAKKYGLFIWNHGTGWVKNRDLSLLGISYDDQSGNHITTNQLKIAMGEISSTLGRKLDLLVFDACLMQMMEIGYALQDDVRVMVGSEEVIPYDGFDYHHGIQPILDNPQAGPELVAEWMSRQFDESYDQGSQGKESTAISYVNLQNLPSLAAALDHYARVAMGREIDIVRNVLQDVQRFNFRSNRDLRHFMMLISQRSQQSDIIEAAQAVVQAHDEYVALSLYNEPANAWQRDLSNSHGVAIYFPSRASAFSLEYLKLDFAKETLWDEYLRVFLETGSNSQSVF